MALCNEFKDTGAIADVARYIIETIPSDKLERYAKFSEAFKKGGFRLSNIKGIRSQVLRLVESQEVVDGQLKKLLADHSQCSRVLSLLSTGTILDHRKELEAFFGPKQVLFAALLDEREKIRTEAIAALPGKETPEEQGGEEEDSLPWARSRLGDLLSPLFHAFGTEGTGEAAPSASGNFAVDQELKELRAKARRLERAEKQLELAQAKEKDAEEKAEKRELEAQESARETGLYRQRAEKAESELARNQANARSQADAIVQTRLATEFAAWLGGERRDEVEQALPKDLFPHPTQPQAAGNGEKDFEELVAKTRHALEAQTNADAIGGVRSVFEKRLAILRQLLRRSDEALADAMRPTEGLLEVRAELEEACKRLETVLHPDAAGDDRITEALSVQINTAPDRKLPEWQHTVEKLHSIGLLDEKSHSDLLAIVRRRYATLHLQGTREIRGEELADKRNVLRLGLEGHLPVVLLIDGHNMLFALQSRYVRPQDHHVPSSEAREWLQEDVVRMVSQSPACRVILAFDGPERSDAFVASNVKLIYSGGTGDHRADRVLVDEARFIVQNGEKVHLLLVTNDRDLADNAAKLGVGNLSPVDLLEHFS